MPMDTLVNKIGLETHSQVRLYFKAFARSSYSMCQYIFNRTFDLRSAEKRNPAWAASFAKVKNRMRK
jgi:hypothetical protein